MSQPVVNITFSSGVVYDPEDRIVHPDTDITFSSTVVYVPPASSVQPDVDITFSASVNYETSVISDDVSGEGAFRISASATNEIEIEAVAVPPTLTDRFVNIQIVSVSMPAPEVFDQFGRPV